MSKFTRVTLPKQCLSALQAVVTQLATADDSLSNVELSMRFCRLKEGGGRHQLYAQPATLTQVIFKTGHTSVVTQFT